MPEVLFESAGMPNRSTVRCRRAAPTAARPDAVVARALAHDPPSQEVVRRSRGAARPRSARSRRTVRRDRRTQRLRQEHAAAADRRSRSRTPGASVLASGVGADDVRVMFQEPRLLPWARVLGNVEVGLGSDRRPRTIAARPGAGRSRPGRRRGAGPPCCRAARSNASRWRGRWSAGRADAGPRRTARRARRADPHRDAAAPRAGVARTGSSPRCWSRTTSRKPWRWPIASSSSRTATSRVTSTSTPGRASVDRPNSPGSRARNPAPSAWRRG